jgi:hypothetical protein
MERIAATYERNYRNGIRRRVDVVNPGDKSWCRQSFVLWFGACGPTYLLVYANGLDSALKTAADWLAENAPDHLMSAWGEDHTALVREACEEAGLPYPPPDDADLETDGYYYAQSDAEADLTYTEAGYLTSYEWGIALENPTPTELRAFVKG